jgi:hypothetical protein
MLFLKIPLYLFFSNLTSLYSASSRRTSHQSSLFLAHQHYAIIKVDHLTSQFFRRVKIQSLGYKSDMDHLFKLQDFSQEYKCLQ